MHQIEREPRGQGDSSVLKGPGRLPEVGYLSALVPLLLGSMAYKKSFFFFFPGNTPNTVRRVSNGQVYIR